MDIGRRVAVKALSGDEYLIETVFLNTKHAVSARARATVLTRFTSGVFFNVLWTAPSVLLFNMFSHALAVLASFHIVAFLAAKSITKYTAKQLQKLAEGK